MPDEALAGAALVHLTGITMALGDAPRGLVLDVARRAQAAGVTVVFDPNYRPAPWESPEAAAETMAPVLEHVDWVLCGVAAGFAYGLLQGWDAPACVRAAHVIAACALRGTGDWETLPRLADVRDLL